MASHHAQQPKRRAAGPSGDANGRGESGISPTGARLPWFPYTYESPKTYSGKLLVEVKEFQKRVGLQGTGVFGARTTEKMNTELAIAGHWGC